jgi:hypothetical protein
LEVEDFAYCKLGKIEIKILDKKDQADEVDIDYKRITIEKTTNLVYHKQ